MKSLKPTLLLSLFGLLLSQAATAAEPANVVIFGDSITSATGYPGCGNLPGQVEEFCNDVNKQNRSREGAINAGFPSQELTRILAESRRPAVVPNWGWGGTTTGPHPPDFLTFSTGSGRIIRNLDESKSDYPSDTKIVLIMYGTNDAGFGISPSDTGFNIKVMIDRARPDYVPVIATLTPRTSRSVTSYNSAIASAAANRGAPLVDMYTRFNAAGGTSLLFDGLHPTAAGYTVIAETWFNEYLQAAIEPKPVVIAPILLLLMD